tara:strand:- start:1036 stop:1545 length:510 start_codon:yes stop_codon:yes gene_type:complete
MKLGNKCSFVLILIYLMFNLNIFAEEKIVSTPLINLNDLTPSFEETDSLEEDLGDNIKLKNKKENINIGSLSSAKLIGLDKITAKTSIINITLGETKKFGPLEIKVLKCGKISTENKNDNVAYLQVKDLSENENEKVFIFNGWTFSSDPTLAPFDHAIYDIQLLSCANV